MLTDLDGGGRVSLAEHVHDHPAGADVVGGAGVVARVGDGGGVLQEERRSLVVVLHRDAAIRVVVDHALVVVPLELRLVNGVREGGGSVNIRSGWTASLVYSFVQRKMDHITGKNLLVQPTLIGTNRN